MELRAIIDQTDIRAVWLALGGPELRSNRGPAFWRGGRNANVAVYPLSRSWRDYKTQEGGGVLDLVQVATGLSRADAASWVADFNNVSLDDQTCSRQTWQRTDALARTLAAQQNEIVRFLRAIRNSIRCDCRALSQWATEQGQFGSDQRWRDVNQIDDRLRLADAIDAYIACLQSMDAREFLALHSRLGGTQS